MGAPALDRPPVMKDVAKVAGVSHQTVSRVLNGHPNVSQAARERVEAAISELGYRRNGIARSLATRRSQTVGVLASDLSQYGPARTLLGVESAAREAGYFVSIASLRDVSAESVTDAMDHFCDQGVDGVIVVVPHPAVLEALDQIKLDFPVITATSATHRPSPGAAVNQRLGAKLAVEHLIGLGHTCIGHLSGPLDWFDAAERLEGWRETLEEAGLKPGPVLNGDWSADSGYMAGTSILSQNDLTAVFVSNDQMALGLMLALHERSVTIPADISIVAYDDQPEAGYFYPPLTTVRQDFEELGRQCIAVLLESLSSKDENLKRLVEPRMVIRATTGKPKVRDVSHPHN
jgi:DNA-binding LacI/PurR family transcriptional regulator